MLAARRGDDALGDLALEHQGQRPPPWRPCLAAQPAQEQRRADIVGQVGDDMRAVAGLGALVDLHRVAADDPQPARKRRLQFGQRRQAAPVALDGDDIGAGIEQRAGQSAGAGADFINGGAVERAGNGGDARQQLAVEDEILPERLGRLQAVAGDDVAQRLAAPALIAASAR